MPNYQQLELQELLDLLVQYTETYTSMMSEGTFSVEEIAQCKHSLREIQGAIILKQGRRPEYVLDFIPRKKNRSSTDD